MLFNHIKLFGIYHECDCDIAELSNPVVDEDDDVDLEDGDGVLEDSDHKSR